MTAARFFVDVLAVLLGKKTEMACFYTVVLQEVLFKIATRKQSNRPRRLMKTSSIAVETSRSTS